jgi:hypothetical protein
MILRTETLDAIRQGRITVLFRRWKRPSVRTGGTLMTAIGRLHIRVVQPVGASEISSRDAKRAGYASREALLSELDRWEGQIYRIEIGPVEEDPRIALRARPVRGPELESVLRRLDRMDASSPSGPWSRATLELIRDHPEVRAGDLSVRLGLERLAFKQNVRKLKALGLTESLPIGYRLSPRGVSVLDGLRRPQAG